MAKHAIYEKYPQMSKSGLRSAGHAMPEKNAERIEVVAESRRRAVDVLFGMLAAIVLGQPSHAQESSTSAQADPADAATQIEEILVTASKRPENLQAVPISVTAISGDALATGR